MRRVAAERDGLRCQWGLVSHGCIESSVATKLRPWRCATEGHLISDMLKGIVFVSRGFWLYWLSWLPWLSWLLWLPCLWLSWLPWLLWLLWRLAFVAFVASGCLLPVHLLKSEAQLPDVRRSCFHPDDSFRGFWLLVAFDDFGFRWLLLPFRGFGWLLLAFRVFIHWCGVNMPLPNLSTYPSICLYLSIFLSVCLSIYLYLFISFSLAAVLLSRFAFAFPFVCFAEKKPNKQASASCSPLDLVRCWGGALPPPNPPPRHEISTSSPTPAPATKSIC